MPIELGLQRISRLLARSPLPWRAVHVAGTNGKGSVCNYISAMLETYNKSDYRMLNDQSPLKHGRFTSPHLMDRWDCITINQETISEKLFKHIEQQVKRRSEDEGIGASEFELLTATAFECFTHEQVDVGVVEVGMGGRLDATNILGQAEGLDSALDPATARPLPLVTAITSIGLDHQAFLGDTIEAIAKEKAGIFKPHVPAVWPIEICSSAENLHAVRKVLRECAHHANSDVNTMDSVEPQAWSTGTRSSRVLKDLYHELLPSDKHTQRRVNNLMTAIWSTLAALAQLKRIPALNRPYEEDIEYSQEKQLLNEMIGAASQTQFAGRSQHIDIGSLTGRKKWVLLDGAHNRDAAEYLNEEVTRMRTSDEFSHNRYVVWLLAFSATKDVKEILKCWLNPGDKISAVEFGPVKGMPWVKPMSVEDIKRAVEDLDWEDRETPRVYTGCAHDVKEAISQASQLAHGGPVVIAGSLYLVGDVLRVMRDRELRQETIRQEQIQS